MNKRTFVLLSAWIVCLGTVSAVLVQQSRLGALRGRQPLTPTNPEVTEPGISTLESGSQNPNSSVSDDPSRELLRLRAEVTKLTARKRELAGVITVSEGLRAQLATTSTNSGSALPPGYVRRSAAQFLGYSTPETTIQSWLWALQNHDFAKLLQALSPAEAQNVQALMQAKGDHESFFKELSSIHGMAIQSRKLLTNGGVELDVYVAPGLPPQQVRLQLLNGDWKIERW